MKAEVTFGAKLSDTLRHIANAKDACLVIRNNTDGNTEDQALYAISQLHMASDDIRRAWDKVDELHQREGKLQRYMEELEQDRSDLLSACKYVLSTNTRDDYAESILRLGRVVDKVKAAHQGKGSRK